MTNIIYIIKSLILPPGILILLLLLGIVFWRKKPIFSKIIIIFALICFYFMSTYLGSWLLAYPLQYHSNQIANKNSGAQAIVVLGGGRYPGAPEYGRDDVGKTTLRRLQYAAYLSKKTNLPILTSGGSVFNEKTSEATLMANVLATNFHVTTKYIEQKSKNTKQNAEYSSLILRRNRINKIFLVTSAIHMQRATLAFKKEHIEVIPAATDYVTLPAFNKLGYFLPDATPFKDSCKAIHEYLGLATAKVY